MESNQLQSLYSQLSGKLNQLSSTIEKEGAAGTLTQGRRRSIGKTLGLAPSVVTSKSARQKTKSNKNKLQSIENNEQAAINQAQQLKQTMAKLPEEQRGNMQVNGSQVSYSKGGENPGFGMSRQQQLQLSQIDSQFSGYTSVLNARSNNLDTQMQRKVASINNVFEQRREVARDATERNVDALDVIGKVSGLSRYAGNYQTSLVTGAEEKGLEILSEIDSQEQEFIRAAEEANAEKQFGILNQQMKALEGAQDRKRQVLNDIFNQAVQSQRLFMEEQNFALKYEEAQIDIQNGKLEQQIPTIYNDIQNAETAEEGAEILRAYAAQLGVEPSAVFGEMTRYSQNQQEYELDIQGKRLGLEAAQQQMQIRAEELAMKRQKMSLDFDKFNASQSQYATENQGQNLLSREEFKKRLEEQDQMNYLVIEMDKRYQDYLSQNSTRNISAKRDGNKYSSSSIPGNLRSELSTNILNGATMEQLLDAYPDVSSSYINSLKNSLLKGNEDLDFNDF